jgi:DNA invertase Pin-like site-specific DNA recombinase
MGDTADRILDDLRRRRDELKPLVAELERIEAAIDALERASADEGAANGRAAARPAGRRRGRPRKGEPNRTDQFLALVRAGGISIPAAAQELGIGPNYLYRIANSLQSEGTIRKQGREYVMAVDGESNDNAEVVEPPSDGNDDDLVTDEGVNEGTREIATE